MTDWTRTDYATQPLHVFVAFLACRERAIRNGWYAGIDDQPMVQAGSGLFTVEQARWWASMLLDWLARR
jgi:hypothetical protein